jgi:prepilin-type processing-associated H-X9-DG protein
MFVSVPPLFATIRRRSPRRIALTLVENLVAIATIGILIGLIAPAVQRARASAQQYDCANRLRQVGLALAMYHGTHGSFPAGMSLVLDSGDYPYLGWNARILPFLEQETLWGQVQAAFASDVDFLHVPPHVNRGTVVKSFTCPADDRSAAAYNAPGVTVAFTAYLGVEGTDQYQHDGILYCDSQVRMGDIADGTSNTLLVGERPASTDYVFGWWYAGWGQDKDGSAEMVLGVRELFTCQAVYNCNSQSSHFQAGSYANQCDYLHFWSLHPGGANFLFADGAVHFLGYESDSILPALATRSGGENVESP